MSFFYAGYGPDAPAYYLEYWDGKHWGAQTGGWCGVGLGFVEISPGESAYFAIALVGLKSPARAAITFYRESQGKSGHVAFSREFSFSEQPFPIDESTPLPEMPVDVTAPRLISKIVPEYPEVARRAGIQGTIIISCLIDMRGSVQDPKIVQSIPLLDDSALAAVRQWKYHPAKHKGHPVAVHTTIHVSYDLGKPKS